MYKVCPSFSQINNGYLLSEEANPLYSFLISTLKGSASKATGVTTRKPEVISEVSSAILRMQKLAGIIK